jgi:hypothetical protein
VNFFHDHELKINADRGHYDIAFGMCKLINDQHIPSQKFYLYRQDVISLMIASATE